MISDEYMLKAAARMQDAAERSQAAADRIEQNVQRLAYLLEDAYGGNGLRLIEALETAKTAQESEVELLQKLQFALEAIAARINGEWDNPALVAFGVLKVMEENDNVSGAEHDVLLIANAALLAVKMKGCP